MSDEIDLESLDAYLSSDDSPDDCMMLSDLDGFLHGVVCWLCCTNPIMRGFTV